MFDTFEDWLKKTVRRYLSDRAHTRRSFCACLFLSFLSFFVFKLESTQQPRCSFDSSHLPWSFWTVWSTATVRRRRIAGGETKEVTPKFKPRRASRVASHWRTMGVCMCVRERETLPAAMHKDHLHVWWKCVFTHGAHENRQKIFIQRA